MAPTMSVSLRVRSSETLPRSPVTPVVFLHSRVTWSRILEVPYSVSLDDGNLRRCFFSSSPMSDFQTHSFGTSKSLLFSCYQTHTTTPVRPPDTVRMGTHSFVRPTLSRRPFFPGDHCPRRSTRGSGDSTLTPSPRLVDYG